MTELEKWISLAEQHAKLIRGSHWERMILEKNPAKSLRTFSCAKDSTAHEMDRLARNLRANGYTQSELDALYNERVYPILNRRIER